MRRLVDLHRARKRVALLIQEESAGGVVMLLAAAIALVLANSGFAEAYSEVIHLPLLVGIGSWQASHSLAHWVADVGMILFFFVVGMELKRELREGVLADARQVMLPLVAAVCGMAMPAAIFMLCNRGIAAHAAGWAIPSATDIAFALAVLLLAARNAPPAMKILLLAIAIFDDLGAILIIGLFYSQGIALLPLAVAGALLLVLLLLNRSGVTALVPYLLAGAALCYALSEAGVHATIGGVAAGLAIPLRYGTQGSNSPLNRCLHGLHPWVSFGLLPLFALTSAGIAIDKDALEMLLSPLPLGVMLGLFLGKPIGICAAYGGMRLAGLTRLPEDMTLLHLVATGVLAGIGFTMSLFITNLAFADPQLVETAKMGVVAGSLLSALLGLLLMQVCTGKKELL